MTVEIRAARPEESEALVSLYEWLFEPPGRAPPRWDPRRAAIALRDAIESDDAAVLLAEMEGSPVGLCVVYQDIRSVRFDYRAWVEDLAVHPRHRSQGIGSRLLAAARDWARKRGATHLELDTSVARVDAQRFYEREGADHRGVSYSWEL